MQSPYYELAGYSGNARIVERLRVELQPMTPDLFTTSEWSEFEAFAVRAHCWIAVVPWLANDDTVANLVHLKAHAPFTPAVLVTEPDSCNLRLLRKLPVEEVLFLSELSDVRHAVRRAHEESLRNQIDRIIVSSELLSPQLRRALSHAWMSSKPLRSVEELATEVGLDRSTLWYHWTRSLGRNCKFRLQDFLGWILLLRASSLKSKGQSWASVAVALDVHEHTIARLSKRLAGLTLTQLRASHVSDLFKVFQERLLHHVCGSGLHVLASDSHNLLLAPHRRTGTVGKP